MIDCQLEPLSAEADRALRAWLRQPAREVFARVVASQVKRFQAEALHDAVDSKEYGAKLDAANAKLRVAQRYQICLDVLNEMLEQREIFQTVKLT